MARSRHAMRVHPLRSKAVVVGVPVAAAVAFGAHAVLGVVPLSDQQDTSTSSSAPRTGSPVQSYGLATTPPPTTLGLLSGPTTAHGAATDAPTPGAAHSSSSGGSRSAGSSSTVRDAAVPAGSIPIARAATAPAGTAAPSMMTFTPVPAAAPAAGTHEDAPQAAPRAAARAAEPVAAPAAAQDDGSSDQQPSSGVGSLLGVDLGVAKISVLSFGG